MALIRHLALRCRDMHVTRKFYETAFGWEFLGMRPSNLGCDLSDGTHNVTLLQQPADDDRPAQRDGQEYLHFGIIVEDLAVCRERLEALGAEFATDAIKLQQQGDGSEISFKVLDPDGNVIDVTCNHEEWKGVTI